jgi:hypothetical protein
LPDRLELIEDVDFGEITTCSQNKCPPLSFPSIGYFELGFRENNPGNREITTKVDFSKIFTAIPNVSVHIQSFEERNQFFNWAILSVRVNNITLKGFELIST